MEIVLESEKELRMTDPLSQKFFLSIDKEAWRFRSNLWLYKNEEEDFTRLGLLMECIRKIQKMSSV
jgi:hypothetical protein